MGYTLPHEACSTDLILPLLTGSDEACVGNLHLHVSVPEGLSRGGGAATFKLKSLTGLTVDVDNKELGTASIVLRVVAFENIDAKLYCEAVTGGFPVPLTEGCVCCSQTPPSTKNGEELAWNSVLEFHGLGNCVGESRHRLAELLALTVPDMKWPPAILPPAIYDAVCEEFTAVVESSIAGFTNRIASWINDVSDCPPAWQ